MKALRLFILLCLVALTIATGNASAAQQDDGACCSGPSSHFQREEGFHLERDR